MTSPSAPALTFEDAEPVKRNVVGRTAEPNPFVDIVSSIALKTDETTGKAVAKSFVVPTGTYDEDDKPADDTARAFRKVLRQLSDAGNLQTPQVTVNRALTAAVDAKGK